MLVDELIREAFPADNPPGAEQLVTDECSFCVAIRDALQGRRWNAVPTESLDDQVGSVPQLTPAAFVYYIPAFLLRAVAKPWEPGVGTSIVLFHTVQSVCDPALPEDEWWSSRFPLLNDAQRAAVAAFVEWAGDTLAADDDEADLRAVAEAGLRKYWGKYVSRDGGRRRTRG